LLVRDSSVVRRHYILLLEPSDVRAQYIRKTADLPHQLWRFGKLTGGTEGTLKIGRKMLPAEGSHVWPFETIPADSRTRTVYSITFKHINTSKLSHRCAGIVSNGHTCEPSAGSIFLPILRVPSVPPVNFPNLLPVKKIKYNKILTYILQSIFLEIPHLELYSTERDIPWLITPRDIIFNPLDISSWT
jgi:hypothetical protein